jgi:hypothetical protein
LASVTGGWGAMPPLPGRPAHPETAAIKKIDAKKQPNVLPNIFSLTFDKGIFRRRKREISINPPSIYTVSVDGKYILYLIFKREKYDNFNS